LPDSQLPLPFLNNGIAQVALIVPNLETAVENYSTIFGIGDWHFYTYEKPFVKKMSYHGQDSDHSFRVALGYFGSMRVELIEVQEGKTIYQEFIDQHGYGVHHFGVLVESMEIALNQAAEAGLEMIQDGSGFGPDGDGHYAYLNTEGPLGVTIELIERPKQRHPPEKIYPQSKSQGKYNANTRFKRNNSADIETKA
jgi:4-hydroxyphenylpyruvate dioxygenase-like putative hemolysin